MRAVGPPMLTRGTRGSVGLKNLRPPEPPFWLTNHNQGLGKFAYSQNSLLMVTEVVICRATGKYSVQATSGPSCLWHLHINDVTINAKRSILIVHSQKE